MYIRGSEIYSGFWVPNLEINYFIAQEFIDTYISADFAIGTHNLILAVTDQGGNQVFHLLKIVVQDNIEPVIDNLSAINSTYQLGVKKITLSLRGYDYFPDIIILRINGIVINTSYWTSGELITYIIESPDIGNYNISYEIGDRNGNIFSGNAYFEIYDSVAPAIMTNAEDKDIELGNAFGTEWIINDISNFSYTLKMNNKIILSSSSSDEIVFEYNFHPNQIGIYRFEFTVRDISENLNNFSFTITVQDTIKPIIQDLENTTLIIVEEVFIAWIVTDASETGIYNLKIDGEQFIEENWNVSRKIGFQFNEPEIRSYLLVLKLIDSSNNTNEYSIILEFIIDDLEPVLNSPDDIAYLLGETGNRINWEIFDDNPLNYSIYFEGRLIEVGSYIDNNQVVINVDELTKGIYNFTIEASDKYGNSNHDTVLVTVINADLLKINGSDWINIILTFSAVSGFIGFIVKRRYKQKEEY